MEFMLPVVFKDAKEHLGSTKQERFELVISVCSTGFDVRLSVGKKWP